MTFCFHAAAKVELNQAEDYYESCEPDLGYEFLEEVYAAIGRVLEFPSAWRMLSPRTRRCLTRRFPYAVIYQVRDESIRVLAIAHSHPRPGYWTDRQEN